MERLTVTAYLSACLPTFLSGVPAYVTVCLAVCMSVWLRTRLLVCLLICLIARRSA